MQVIEITFEWALAVHFQFQFRNHAHSVGLDLSLGLDLGLGGSSLALCWLCQTDTSLCPPSYVKNVLIFALVNREQRSKKTDDCFS